MLLCATLVLPADAVELEPLRVQASNLVLSEIRPALVWHLSIYHPPKFA